MCCVDNSLCSDLSLCIKIYYYKLVVYVSYVCTITCTVQFVDTQKNERNFVGFGVHVSLLCAIFCTNPVKTCPTHPHSARFSNANTTAVCRNQKRTNNACNASNQHILLSARLLSTYYGAAPSGRHVVHRAMRLRHGQNCS